MLLITYLHMPAICTCLQNCDTHVCGFLQVPKRRDVT